MSASLADSAARLPAWRKRSGWQPNIRFSDTDPIMLRRFHSRDERLRFRKNHRFAFIRAGEFPYSLHGIESQQSNELHFVAALANKQFRAPIAVDFSRSDARENFVAQHFLVRPCVSWFGPAVPDPRDHMPIMLRAHARD